MADFVIRSSPPNGIECVIDHGPKHRNSERLGKEYRRIPIPFPDDVLATMTIDHLKIVYKDEITKAAEEYARGS